MGLSESNIPMQFLPFVHVLPDIIHQCHENYDPIRGAVMSPNQTVLLKIIAESINNMLQFHPNEALTPISIGNFLEKSTQLSQAELNRLCETFILQKYQHKNPPPYMSIFFTNTGKIIVDMISTVMGFNTSEYVYELTLVMMSIFTPG